MRRRPSSIRTTWRELSHDRQVRQMDLMLLAQSCGMTNVSTFMFANADSWQYYPFATGFPAGSSPAGANEEHHGTSHCDDSDSANIENLVLINTWQAMQVNYMLDLPVPRRRTPTARRCSTTRVLLWGNELGVGNTHDFTRTSQWLVAGERGGAIKVGPLPSVPRTCPTTTCWCRSATPQLRQM